jgi:CheY-like chemotaxis protein/nucleoside-triphosphatase THEP1
MSDEAAALFRNILTRSSKVVLITGPTGSGKTSTLYAGVLHLRNANSRIITIEDPIEYRIEGISQIQVNPKIDMTFATALRSVLRQDPDVILVGEIRDAETATTAMQVAQTGHLVLSTLHTNTAASAITRLRDLGIASFLIASSLGTLVAQRLVRRLCSHCQIPISGEEEEKALKLGLDPALLASAKGCDECGGTGYRGRVALFSILDITPEVATAIRNELPEDEIEQAARSGGFWHLEEAVVPFLCSRTTSLSEAERVLGSLDTRLLAPHNPRPKSSSAVAQESVQRSPSKDSTVEIPKRRVMIVDDDEGIRAIFQSLLEFEMFEVVSAADGHEALKLIYEQQPELVLCDLMMPNMNGEELLGRLRGDARTREIPVLVLTAAATEENELDLLKKGADDFVSKTARAEIIVARINRLLNRVVA